MIELTSEQLAELAHMVAERLRGVLPDQPTLSATGALVDAQTVAAALGVDRSWVYEHASDLGGKRIGKVNVRAGGSISRRRSRPEPPNRRRAWWKVFRPRKRTRRAGGNGSVPLMAIRGER